MKSCLNCGATHSKTGTCCSRSCACSYGNKLKGPRSQETKEKISSSVLKSMPSKEILSMKGKLGWSKEDRKPKSKKKRICVVCNAEHEKYTKTCSKPCNVELASMNALKQVVHGGGKKGKYKGYHCDSSYELAFLIYNLDHGIPIERCSEFLSYTVDGITKKYLPDFIVGGLTYEIKGFMSETAKKKLSDNPHVVLIDKHDIKPYIDYVKTKYSVNDVTALYENRKCKRCGNEMEEASKETYCSDQCKKKRPLSKEHREKLSNALKGNTNKRKWMGRDGSNVRHLHSK